jgi:hypothetical protein
MVPYSLFLSCDMITTKENSESVCSVTTLLLHANGIKSILFNHLENPMAYG